MAGEICALEGQGVVRVAVDGVDGAGKTSFSDELAAVLERRSVAVVRASVDNFHNPAHIRYARGRASAEGFFLDSYDYGSLRRLLLDPLGPGGDRRVVRRIYDVHNEQRVLPRTERAAIPSVLIFDGIFLHRPELLDCWDYSVFLDVPLTVAIARGAQRGYGDADPNAESNRRYVEGQRMYLRECQPQRQATVVIDNTILAQAHIASRNYPDTTADELHLPDRAGRPW